MSTINFLPVSYQRQQFRRVRIAVEAGLVLVVAAVLVVVHLFADAGMQEQRDYAAQLRAEGTAIQKQFKELATLQADHRELANQLRVHRQVILPVSFTNLLAAISDLAPQAIALTDLRMETKPPVPAAAQVASGSSSKKGGKPKSSVAPVKSSDPLRIEVTGLSPDDGRVADFVGALAESPLFSDVKLLFSRTSEQNGVISRRFRVTMDVRLDRNYVNLAARRVEEGVANAD